MQWYLNKVILVATSILLGAFFVHWLADHALIWQGPVVPSDAVNSALRYYSHIYHAPRFYVTGLSSLAVAALGAAFAKLVLNPVQGLLFDGGTSRAFKFPLLRRRWAAQETDPAREYGLRPSSPARLGRSSLHLERPRRIALPAPRPRPPRLVLLPREPRQFQRGETHRSVAERRCFPHDHRSESLSLSLSPRSRKLSVHLLTQDISLLPPACRSRSRECWPSKARKGTPNDLETTGTSPSRPSRRHRHRKTRTLRRKRGSDGDRVHGFRYPNGWEQWVCPVTMAFLSSFRAGLLSGWFSWNELIHGSVSANSHPGVASGRFVSKLYCTLQRDSASSIRSSHARLFRFQENVERSARGGQLLLLTLCAGSFTRERVMAGGRRLVRFSLLIAWILVSAVRCPLRSSSNPMMLMMNDALTVARTTDCRCK